MKVGISTNITPGVYGDLYNMTDTNNDMKTGMTLGEIRSNVNAGIKVNWSNDLYEVQRWGSDLEPSYQVVCTANGFAQGLTNRRTGEMIQDEKDFYIA